MRGRKPKLHLVIPTCSEDGPTPETVRETVVAEAIRRLRPRGLPADVAKEWDRVARLLSDPVVDRLKPRFVDVIVEYCRATVRLRKLRAFFDDLAEKMAAESKEPPNSIAAEIHETAGRNGEQLKCHPLTGQMNEAWRQWRALVQMLGLSPADERNMLPGQGDLFDESDRHLA